jgi:PAS domain S-box-containing protein
MNDFPADNFSATSAVQPESVSENGAVQGENYYRRQLEAVCNNATVSLFIMDEHQHCIYMNPAAEKLTGYTLDEVHGRALHDVIHHTRPDGSHYPLEECPIDRAFPQNTQEQGEETFVHKDGSFYPVAFTASPIREDGIIVGTIIEVLGTAEEKQAAAERHQLLRSEQEAREETEVLYRIGQTLSGELDLQKLVQAVTDAATELTGAQFGSFFYNLLDEHGASYTLYTLSGVPREAFAGFPMPRATDLFGPTFRGEDTIRIADVRQDARYGRNVPHYGMPAGHLPVVSYLAVPVISRSGEVLGGLFFGHPEVGVFTERHERLLAGLAAQTAIAVDNANLFEAVRREQEKTKAAFQQMHNLLESITDAFFALDSEWRFTYLNQQAGPLLQRLPQELLGKNVWEEFPAAVGTIFDKQYRKAMTEQISVRFEEFYPPLNTWFEVHAYPLEGGLSVFFHDINERKQFELERTELLNREQQARQEAEAANRTKDEFLATLSHELRTPLTAILGWSRMISDDRLSQEDKARGLEAIQRNAQLQSQLIEDILDVSRIITGKFRLDVQATELATVIESAVESVLPAAQAKEIRLQRVLDSGTSLVSGDPNRLQQVIWNLLTNAIKFTPKGGRVQVRLERINSHVEIVVSDSGEGIKPEVLPYVFDRFHQADSTMTRNYGGLGLGLAIVRHIVELHGGTVEAYSAGIGQGATFTVKLPLMATRSTEPEPATREERVHPTASLGADFECPPELEGLHVLVLDDDEDARHLIQTVLQRCLANVTTASTVADAMEVLQRTRPDVLISDLGMPGEDGYSLIRQVRALSPAQGGQTPAAALTAYARLEDRMRVLRSGFQIHLPKPIEPAELVAVVANLADRIRP